MAKTYFTVSGYLCRHRAWHHSSTDVSLKLASPADYCVADAVREADPGHGGVAVFYRRHYKSNRVTLPRLSAFEGLCLRLFIGGRSFIVLCIYRPPSASLSSFFTELSDVLEILVTYGCPVITGGYLNVHVEDPTDNDAIAARSADHIQPGPARYRSNTPSWRYARPVHYIFRLSSL